MIAPDRTTDLATRLRLDRQRQGWRGDCPACGYARTFALRPRPGGGTALFCANGCTKDELHRAARSALGSAWAPPAQQAAQDVAAVRAGKQAAAARLFAGSAPLTTADPAGLYLGRRGLAAFTSCPVLRYRGDCRHQDGGRLPALVAEVVDAAGQPIAVHRTYLAWDGHKAGVEPCKMTLGPMWGGAVRLTSDLEPLAALVVGEGIETSASAGLLLGLPAWAALFAGNLGCGLVLPKVVRAVTIAADHDRTGIGQRAAEAAAARWRAEGRTVRIALPDVMGQDFNDILQARLVEAAHG